jgi:tRNA(fMet)-specific endonuclease VapC
MSVITEAEFRYVLQKNPHAQTLRLLLEALFLKIQILPWGRAEAMAYGQLRAKQEAAGKGLGSLDMLIAAHAIATGAVLVTTDKAFFQISDLPASIN